MKYCMIVAGNSEFYTTACTATDRLGYTPLVIESGFHSYSADDGDSVHIAIMDIETLRSSEIIEKLDALESGRRLMLFCPTPKDAERLKEVFNVFPGRIAILPFSPVS